MKTLKSVLSSLIISGLIFTTTAKAEKIYVFAAASTTNAVSEICKNFNSEHNMKTVNSFASSSTLARQIAAGAPANIYISANPKWMTFLLGKEMIEKSTKCDLLGNRIVLIAPSDSNVKSVDIKLRFKLPFKDSTGRISMGDPDHVPAGIYGKQALTSLKVWDSLQRKVIRAKDVRAALVFVERGEAPFGIVYSTDAAITKKVKVVGVFPENTHPAITYQAGIVKGKMSDNALKFFSYLRSKEAGKVFKKYGFSVK